MIYDRISLSKLSVSLHISTPIFNGSSYKSPSYTSHHPPQQTLLHFLPLQSISILFFNLSFEFELFKVFFDTMGCVATDAQFHVLAVDDSIIDRKLIERLLKTSSYQVTAVDSGSKALDFLGLEDEEERNSHPPPVSANHHHQQVDVNLIITDYCMPGMTGYDLLRKIKGSSSLKDIPVVIMSSENVPSRINRCLEQGAEDFFLKPVQQSDVNKLRPHLLRGKAREQINTSNKRKVTKDCLSPEKTRTRFSDLELVQ